MRTLTTGDDPHAARQLAQFQALWLDPVRQAPGGYRPGKVTVAQGELSVTARPFWPERADWNQQPDGTPRLFNNRGGLFFDVAIDAPFPVRWEPSQTRLEINRPGDGLLPYSSPEEALLPLLQAALLQERAGQDGDLVSRSRRAGGFRSAYLPANPTHPPLAGVLGFSLQNPDQAMAALRLTLALETPTGLEQVVVVFD